MRYVCLVMALVFVQFTYWQWNDLNQYNTRFWYLWVVAYGGCAVVSLLCWWVALPRVVYAVVSVVALVAALIRFQAIDWDHRILFNPDNPSGNETGGLLIVAIWFAVLAWRRASLVCNSNRV